MQRKFDDFIMSQVIDKYNDDLIVLGARPAIGKSTFLASLAKILSLDNDIPTVVFCPEMAKEVFVRRILQIVLGVSREDIASDDFWDIFDNKQVDDSVADICEKPLYIDDTPAIDIEELKRKLYTLVQEHGVKFVLIDYLQLLNTTKGTSRQENIRYICQTLKAISKELHLIIVLASQCRRNLTNGSNVPVPDDVSLFESFDDVIEHTWTLYRPSYYNVFEDERGCDVSNTIELHRYNGKDFIAKETFIFDKSIPRLI